MVFCGSCSGVRCVCGVVCNVELCGTFRLCVLSVVWCDTSLASVRVCLCVLCDTAVKVF